MGFVYRLQKVYELRERKLKEQERRVIDAQDRLRKVEAKIVAKRTEIRTMQADMQQAHFTMLEVYDRFLYKLAQDLEELAYEKQRAQDHLAYQKQLLIKAQADLEALTKHKESAKEVWLEEEKVRDMRQMDEVAGQRYFRATQERLLEELEE
jgi:flagellar export protein FliJ